MLRLIALTMLVFILPVSALASQSSQADSVEVLESRHTPGFPGILNVSSISDLLKVASPDMRRALERLLECGTLECVEQDELSARIVQSLLYNSTGFNVSSLNTMNDKELLSLINDTSIRGLLEALNTTGGYVSPSDLDKLLATLEDAYRRGYLSPQAYMAALEILKRIIERTGSPESSYVERKQVEALRDIIVEASRRGLLSELIERLSALYRESQALSLNSNIERGNLEIKGPRVRFELPSVSSDIVLLFLLAILASLTLFNSQRLGALLGSMLGSITKEGGSVGGLGGAPLVPRLYWSSVKIVEGVSGVVMGVSTTHREYLADVQSRLGNLIVPFENLTLSYELYRYAGLRGREVEEQALRFYNELVELRGRRVHDIGRGRES